MALLSRSTINAYVNEQYVRNGHHHGRFKRFVKQQNSRRERREEAKAIRDQLEALTAQLEAERLMQDGRLLTAFMVEGKFKHLTSVEAEVFHEFQRDELAYIDYEMLLHHEQIIRNVFSDDDE